MLVLLVLSAVARAHVPVVYIAGPDEDWCQVIADAQVGDSVMLLGGDYFGPCTLVETVEPDFEGETLRITAIDFAARPTFRPAGDEPVLTVEVGAFELEWLDFVDVPEGAAAIRATGGAVRLEHLVFDHAGTALTVAGDLDWVEVSETEVRAASRALVLGCDDGSCAAASALVEESLLNGVGEGIVAGVGTALTVTDTVIAAGVGVVADGPVALVGDLIIATDQGVVLGGVGQSARNNVIVAPKGLVTRAGAAGLDLVGNTLTGAVDLAAWDAASVFEDNAVGAELPDVAGGGNVSCAAGGCWVDPAAHDLSPMAGSPLLAGVTPTGEPLTVDWCGRTRADPPTVGAFEWVDGGPVGPLPTGASAPVGFKDQVACPESALDTDAPTDTAGAGDPPVEQGCGCATARPAGWLAIALAAAVSVRRRRRAVAAAILSVAPASAEAHVVVTHVLGPTEDWCTYINTSIVGGDLILLAPGDYVEPCVIVGQVPPEGAETTFIQALDPADPPRFLHDGASPWVLRLEGQSVGLLNLAFEGVPAGASAVQIDGVTQLWVKFTTFTAIDGTAVEVLGGLDVRVLDDDFVGMAGAPVVAGCPEGTCAAPDLQFSANLLVDAGTSVIWPGVGGEIADNVFAGAAPFLRWSGEAGAVIQGNLVGGGPVGVEIVGPGATLRNNLFDGGASVGAAATILGNTWTGPVSSEGSAGIVSAGNASAQVLPFPGEGDVVCPEAAACWVDAPGWDFRPVPDGPLDGAGATRADLLVDFCGTERARPAAAGALEWTDGAEPLVVERKGRQGCAGDLPTEEDEVPAGAGPTAVEEPRRCATSPAASAPAVLALALAAWFRTRARSSAT